MFVWLFGKKKQEETPEIDTKPVELNDNIEIGSKWELRGEDGSPWGAKKISGASPVIVRDVKEGWVRYALGIFSDERMKEDAFRHCYKKTSNA